MPDYYVVPALALTATADAIREKTGSSEEIEFTTDGFKDAVEAIDTGTERISVDDIAMGLAPSGLIVLEDATSIYNYAFRYMPKVTGIHAKNVTTTGQYIVGGNITTFVDEARITNYNSYHTFNGSTKLTIVDLNTNANFSNGTFTGCKALNTMVLRSTNGITRLASTNSFANTPFASGKTGGIVYAPESMIDSYKAASNWSALFGYEVSEGVPQNEILPIEGSYYETHWADGTPIE